MDKCQINQFVIYSSFGQISTIDYLLVWRIRHLALKAIEKLIPDIEHFPVGLIKLNSNH